MDHTLAARTCAVLILLSSVTACSDDADNSDGQTADVPGAGSNGTNGGNSPGGVDGGNSPGGVDNGGAAGSGAAVPTGTASEPFPGWIIDENGNHVDEAGNPVDLSGDPNDPTYGGTIDCEGFVLDEGSFTIYPGEDINYCVRMPIPEEWRDVDMALKGWNWNLKDTHHYFMEHSPNPHPDPEAGAVPCNPDGSQPTFSFGNSANFEGATIAFGAGEGRGFTKSAPGYGKYLGGGGHFRSSHHVINFTEEPIEVTAQFKVCVARADETPHLMNSMVCATQAIDVPGASGFARSTCTAIEEVDIGVMASHAHQHLTRFTMQFYDGQRTHDELLYESFDWDSPEIKIVDDNPIRLRPGQGITYTCYYEGTGPVYYQEAATDPKAEHCGAFLGYAYPPERTHEVPLRVFNWAFFPDQVSPVIPSFPGSPI